MCIGAIGFCFNKIVCYGIINNLNDEFAVIRLQLITQGMDFLWVLMILLVCRPRKQWPPYFTLSVHEMRNADGRGNNNNDVPIHEAAPLLVGLISEEFLFDKYDTDRTTSIGSDDAVLFVNPTKYSLDEDDQPNDGQQLASAFEEIREDENSSLKTQSQGREIESDLVQKGVILGFRDKRQIKKQKKAEGQTDAANQQSTVLNRLFGRQSNNLSTDVDMDLSSEDIEAN